MWEERELDVQLTFIYFTFVLDQAGPVECGSSPHLRKDGHLGRKQSDHSSRDTLYNESEKNCGLQNEVFRYLRRNFSQLKFYKNGSKISTLLEMKLSQNVFQVPFKINSRQTSIEISLV